MKNFFRIAALFAALGLAAAFASCSNASGGDAPPLLQTPTPTSTTYTVSFDANDGSKNPAKATQIFTAGTPQNLTSIADLGFKRDNFAFAGWALSSAASEAAYADKAEYTGNISITLYAVWTPIYAVTFDSKGGSEVAGQKVTSGQTASKPADPTKDHFNFAGWCSDENCQTPFDFATPITAPTTLYAKWSNLPVYIVTFDLNGGKYGSNDAYTQNVETGGKVFRPASDPTKGDNVSGDVTTKYTFDNWYADSGCNTLFDFDAMAISGATTVYAKWSETKCYAVKIAGDIEHGAISSDATEHIAAGTLVTLTASPIPGYDLSSYTVTDADSNPVAVTNGKFTMPASPVTVTATFSPIPLTFEAIEAGANVTFTNKAAGPVTYRVNEDDSQTIASGAEVVIPLPNVGDKVSFYGDNATYATSYNKYSNIACDKDCYVYGNIMSLVDSANYESATTLKDSYTFRGLFEGNVHIKNKPGVDLALPATTLASGCYDSMFSGCASLASAPALPATTLASDCYDSMFSGCASLASAPALPATTLAEWCYDRMFSGCASLASAPALPATTLAGSCYKSMFYNCKNLASAPALPATTLASYCYYSMFSGCASLASAPALPATTLAEWCYDRMFSGCAGLTSAPALPATTLAYGCYDSMFSGCASLSSVTCFAVDISATDCTKDWLKGVSSTGTFTGCVKWSRESINIPVGWTVSLTLDMKRRPLTLEAIEAGSIVTFANEAARPVYYNVNGANKQKIDETQTKWISLSNAGDWVCFYGDNATYATSYNKYSNIACDKDCYVYGNIMSLVNSANYESAKKLTGERTFYGLFKDNAHIKNKAGEDLLLPATTLASDCYYSMFSGCASLASAPALPATTLAEWCYDRMFSGCAGLTSAPALPATTLASGCYDSMFSGCASLASAPALPATTLAYGCYDSMFSGCASLASAPALPATTLADHCYASMFSGCASLASAPALPATTLASYCYDNMFSGCASLASITCLATDILAYRCTTDWLKGVKATGTFTKAAGMKNWSRGSDIPVGWTVVDYQE